MIGDILPRSTFYHAIKIGSRSMARTPIQQQTQVTSQQQAAALSFFRIKTRVRP